MEIGLVLIKLADVVARFSLIERDQIFPSKFNKLGQSARHDLCGAADQPFDFLLISGLLSPFKPLHWLPAASVNLTEVEKQAIKLGDHTHPRSARSTRTRVVSIPLNSGHSFGPVA